MRYTDTPSYLILPTEATVRHIAKREGLGELSELEWDFVWDLLAKTGGAQVAELDEDKAMLDAELYAMLEAEAFKQRHPSLDPYRVESKFKRDYHVMQHQLHHLLEALDLNEIPGYNHPTKAVRIVKLVRQMTLRWVTIWDVFAVVGALFEMIDNALQQAKLLSDAERAMLAQFVDPLSENPASDAEFLGIELQLNGINLPEMLRIARQLDTLSEFQRGRSKLLPDLDGEDTKLRSMQDLGELPRVNQQELAVPPALRIKRAVQGEFNVREPHTRRLKKQLLFLVVDGTGSMLWHGAKPASRAVGVLLNRLQAVIDGDAELFVRFFDVNLRQKEYYARDAESARELMRIVADPAQYTGGHTRFTETLTTASSRVGELMNSGTLRAPELAFVTDGGAPVPDISVLNGITMHTVQVGVREVTELSDLARQSGGLGLYVGEPKTT